ncbi:MAG: alpha/beta hydrolase [Cyclobacteriaceae bacterium]|nr:alpha/beta hydrolase [Cyclobacteriaceae bacterium]
MRKKKDKTPLVLKLIRWAYPKMEFIAQPLAQRLFAALFFTPFRYTATEKERKAETFGEKFSLTAAGKKIQCYRWGKSEKTVLVVHGWAGRATQFRRFVKPLTKAGYQVVGFDGPAHGQSEGKKTTIVEFEAVLKELYKVTGEPEAIIAHSFGGGAVLFAAKNGLPVKKLINIASPTIADEIINTYLKAIRGSEKTKAFFKDFIQKKYGQPFDEFTALEIIKHIKQPPELLLVHDENDHEVTLEHPLALRKAYPSAQLLQTKGLGHTRILKDDTVIRQIVTFIGGDASL